MFLGTEILTIERFSTQRVANLISLRSPQFLDVKLSTFTPLNKRGRGDLRDVIHASEIGYKPQ